MARTTLLVPVPEAGALMADSLLKDGQPPHITLVFPFIDAAALTGEVVDELERRCGAVPAFDFRLHQVVPFGKVLFLAPDPAQPFRDLLGVLAAAEPSPPYPVTVTDTIPHLTVAVTNDPSELETLRTRVASKLPVESRAAEVWLMIETGSGWSLERSFALGG